MHKIEQSIQVFLENLDKATPEAMEPLIEEFGENCKKALRECLLLERSEEPFKLRMSNIGRPLRSLMLERDNGKVKFDPQQKLRATYGYIWESLLFFLMQASGLKVEMGKQVSLDVVVGTDQKYTVNGTMDCKIDGEIYDVKSASPWSFNNKFISIDSLAKDDSFGYVGQALGYSLADKSHFAGWIVIDKSDGRIKVVEVPKDGYLELAKEWREDFRTKVRELFFNSEAVIPPCDGVEEETFNRHKTGNLILKKACEFCNYKKSVCHPTLKILPCQTSKAMNPPFKHYVKIERPDASSN